MSPGSLRPVPRWMQRTLGALTRLDDPSRIAPPRRSTAGSSEIPAWVLAVLVVLTIAAITLFAPGARAAPTAPINCQGDQEYYFTLTTQAPWAAGQWWTDCGYRYEPPGDLLTPPPPVIDLPTPPVPEPAVWAQFAAGLGVVGIIAASRLRNQKGTQA